MRFDFFPLYFLFLAIWRLTSGFLITQPPARTAATALWGKVKRGKLSRNVDGSSSTRPKSKKAAATKKKSASKEQRAQISPDLANFFASQDEDTSVATTVLTEDSDDDNEDAATFTSFKTSNKPSTRRERQAARLEEEQKEEEQILFYVNQLQRMLGDDDDDKTPKKKTTLDDILGVTRELIQNTTPRSNMRLLVNSKAGSSQSNYRLAWVGSDDAVTHIGTGLHKVPLARLQEVFLTLPGRGRVVLQEVIRILGPFPNVRNTVSGVAKIAKSKDSSAAAFDEWNVAWDSMIDGTGKEILAGKEENIKNVPLQIHYADPAVVVATMPSADTVDPFANNGENVLLFLREDDLEGKLESLRVA